jgi:thiamine biosynthesis lipoprotein
MSGQAPWLGLAACLCCLLSPASAEPIVLAGPAMGTTYRVVLAREIPGLARGEVHRELEAVLARIDRAASTWRDDSDASRFNRAPAGEWVPVGDDLARIVAIAREVHAETDGAFDITVGPLLRLWRQGREPAEDELVAARRLVGMQLVESRPAAAGQRAALRKLRAGVALDLGGIGPGYGVDCLGEQLVALGSRNHLVELGGEARAWGTRPDGTPWRVALTATAGGVQELLPDRALAFSTSQPGRTPIDPRTGRPAASTVGIVSAEAATCAVADARAVAVALGWLPPE